MNAQIVIPLDGSPLAEQALPCAVTLGQGLPATLVLLHVVSIPSLTEEILHETELNLANLIEQLDERANDYLRSVADRLEEGGLHVQQVVRHGLPAEAIIDYAERPEVELIVMSTHGYSGIRRWMHGSVAEHVLQSARAPLLLIRAREGEKGAPQASCQRILVPLDGSEVAEQVLPPATAIAQAFDAEIVLFQVPIVYVVDSLIGEWQLPIQGNFETAIPDGQAYLNRVAGRLEEQGVNVNTAMEIGAVAESIIEYADSNRIDLVAMCTHGRTGMGRWTLGSVADRVLRAGTIPILLVRAQ